MDSEQEQNPLPRTAAQIAEEIRGRRMIFTDQEWPDDTGSQFPTVYTYAYYIYAGTPVRVHSLPTDRWFAAERLNFRTGVFEENHEVRIKIQYDDYACDADEVSKERFYKACDEYMAYWTPERIAEAEEGRRRYLENREKDREEMSRLAYEAEVKAGLHKNDSRK